MCSGSPGTRLLCIMANTINGNGDGPGGRNETYRIPGRGSEIPRKQVVREVERGNHPNHGIYEREGEKYVRSNPDHLRKNNVDPPEKK